jgi:acid stress chaperone HdeB
VSVEPFAASQLETGARDRRTTISHLGQPKSGGFFGEETLTMKRHFPIVLAVACIGLACQAAMADEIDVSKLTCKDVIAMRPTKIASVAMWVSGYVHGKAGNAMVDTDKADANAGKIADYCKKNADATLASALEAVAKS